MKNRRTGVFFNHVYKKGAKYNHVHKSLDKIQSC